MISVIIPVYNRKDFYMQALRSLSNQTLSMGEFETIVVSNISLITPELPFKCRIILTEDTTLSGKLALGIEYSEGEIISFLEDDDLFSPDKLSEVKNAFEIHGVSFYANRHIKFKSTTYPSELLDRKKETQPKVATITTFGNREVCNLMKLGINHNLSSMSISKGFAIEIKEYLKGLRVGYVDSFIFYSAIVRNKTIGYCASGRPSTVVRIHKANSRSYFLIKDDQNIEANRLIDSIVHLSDSFNPSITIICTMMHMDYLDESIKMHLLKRREAFSDLVGMIKDPYVISLRKDLIIKALIYFISPNMQTLSLIVFGKF
ncbi:MAG: glycosyltransferase family 2 protein [Thermodesulfobium sp.]